MPTDSSIMEEELKNLSARLKRDLHMREVRKLARKHYGLAKNGIQRKQISHLTAHVTDLQPTVSRIYSAQNFLKDNQIKGYLIYLLQMKEYFSREVKAKMEIIQKRENQIKCLVVRLCNMRNEYAKKIRNLPSKSTEFTRLENASNRMDQIERRICTLQAENKDLRENILDMQIFQRQYKKFEKEFRSKIEEMTSAVAMHLDNAIAVYEERERFTNKTKIYQERCAQDVRKASLNENTLNLILKKTKNYEEFEKLQNEERTDIRIAATGALIEKGATELEPILKKEEDLYMDLAKASGQETPKQMKDKFRMTEDKTGSMFSYLEEMLKEINHTQNIIDELKVKNRILLKSMSTSERKLRWEIRENQARLGLYSTDAERAEVHRNQARDELDALLESLWQIYRKCGLDELKFEKRTDECNAEAAKEAVERKIVEYLMLVEYLLMKEISMEEDKARLIMEAEDDSPLIEELSEKEFLDTVQPRILESVERLDALADFREAKSVLPLERLKLAATSAVAEMESEVSENEKSKHK